MHDENCMNIKKTKKNYIISLHDYMFLSNCTVVCRRYLHKSRNFLGYLVYDYDVDIDFYNYYYYTYRCIMLYLVTHSKLY